MIRSDEKMIAIRSERIYTPTTCLRPGVILVKGRKIAAIGTEGALSVPGSAHWIEADHEIVAPGFIEVHIHGIAGAAAIDGSEASLRTMALALARCGVSGFLATLNGPPQRLTAAIKAAVRYAHSDAADNGAVLLGLHLEGPFVNRAKAGALHPKSIQPVSLEQMETYLELGEGLIRQVTIAPELDGALNLARRLRANGVVAALGHSQATYGQALAAIEAGFSHVTHTYNAIAGFNHREPGVLGAALTDSRLSAEVIADGVHVHPAAVRLLVKAKGAGRVVLITDLLGVAGLPDGVYPYEGKEVVLKEGEARLQDGTLAGSVMTMEKAVANMRRFRAAPLNQCLRMASQNPARLIGLAERKGRLASGWDADLVGLDSDLNVRWTMVGGRIVYRP